LRNWRVGVLSFFVWIVFEDLLRKWAANDLAIYATKDILLILTLASAAAAFRPWKRSWRGAVARHRWIPWLAAPTALMVAWAVVGAARAATSDPLVGLLGLRMSFLYVPLLVLGLAYVDRSERVDAFVRLNLLLAVFVVAVALVQVVASPSFLNPAGDVNLVTERTRDGDGVKLLRPASVFVDTGRFAQYLFAMFFVSIGHFAWCLRQRSLASPRRLTWLLVAFAAIVLGIFVS
jgi:hypothetical protein